MFVFKKAKPKAGIFKNYRSWNFFVIFETYKSMKKKMKRFDTFIWIIRF